MNSDKPILVLLDEFLANHDVSENTRKKYRDSLHFFIAWLTRNGDVKNPSRPNILAYKNYLTKSGKSQTTIDNYLVSVRLFFDYLEKRGIHDNVAAGVHSPKRYHGYRRGYLKPDQVGRLLGSVNRDTIIGKRDYAIINLMLRAGLRCIEVSRVNVKDIRIENNKWVIYVQGKFHTDKDCVMSLTDKAVDPVKIYMNELDDTEERHPLFRNHAAVSSDTRITPTTVSRIVKRYMRAININSERLTAHSLRHTFAITLYKSGVPLNEIKALLRHARIETTEIYLSAIEEEKMLEGAAVHKVDKIY